MQIYSLKHYGTPTAKQQSEKTYKRLAIADTSCEVYLVSLRLPWQAFGPGE